MKGRHAVGGGGQPKLRVPIKEKVDVEEKNRTRCNQTSINPTIEPLVCKYKLHEL